MRKIFGIIIAAAWLSGCSTVAGGGQSPIITPAPGPGPVITAPQPEPQPQPVPQPIPQPVPQPLPPVQTPVPDNSGPTETPPSPLAVLPGWSTGDMRGALAATRKACAAWSERDGAAPLDSGKPYYGTIADWDNACFAADYAADDKVSARRFFEQYFLPYSYAAPAGQKTLLTGYYEPQISVRAQKDAIYSEPILEKPLSEAKQNLPRAQINASTAPVIAYGKPIDVFFMQVQGSGRIAFADGRSMRAAYAAHNDKPYKSIGAELVRRGEMTLEQASKQSIEAWMARSGPAKTKALMNANPRYIFFKTEIAQAGEGPKGAMGVPLVPMATIAVDNAYHPYGSLIWMETTLPQYPGDYKGAPAAMLVSAQDTGSAIKGPVRGDLFFGTGETAGNLAGVMKHPVKFTLLLPAALAMRYLPVS